MLQTVAEKQHQKLANDSESNKKEEDKTKNKRSHDKSNLPTIILLFTNIATLQNLLNVILFKTEWFKRV